jgi:hypothetical protein
VHRFGDGQDDAGGLTTAYHVLEEREDADDFGVFIDELTRRFRDASLSSSKSGQSILRKLPNSIYSQVAMYACTEVLVSETRTQKMVEDHFFSTTSQAPMPEQLKQFKRHFYSTLESSTTTMPFWIVKSDLKIILPVEGY